MPLLSATPKSHLWAALSACFIVAVFLWLSPMQTVQSEPSHPVWDLNQHYTAKKRITISGIEDNLSGLTYHPETGHLFAVINNPERVAVLSKHGQLIRLIELEGFTDTEAIDYLGDNQFAISEERHHTTVLVNIDRETNHIERDHNTVIALDELDTNNTGLEGMVLGSHNNLVIALEKPPRLRHFHLDNQHPVALDSPLSDLRINVEDISGLSLIEHHTHPVLLILSDESHRLLAIDPNSGETLSSLSLRRGPLAIWPRMKQPEGITSDEQGNIYIVGEPNQLVILRRHHPLIQ